MNKKMTILFAAGSLWDREVNQVLAFFVFQEWHEMYFACRAKLMSWTDECD